MVSSKVSTRWRSLALAARRKRATLATNGLHPVLTWAEWYTICTLFSRRQNPQSARADLANLCLIPQDELHSATQFLVDVGEIHHLSKEPVLAIFILLRERCRSLKFLSGSEEYGRSGSRML